MNFPPPQKTGYRFRVSGFGLKDPKHFSRKAAKTAKMAKINVGIKTIKTWNDFLVEFF